ncbi:ATP-dependent DNA helicase RecQ [Halpernia frigidisoli]|uniref:ATP-dependent DNA helicase RecQ n=2 Tax=Halpernia frigidisoli TaxID=1125876 RepID=A0A1I3FTT0_9FLAO|nr:ATP-dependent DNA helicase RecQ [Halpernia frigidisoli]
MKTLLHFWGFSAFRENQEEIIDSVISGNDNLILLPTGGGKSLCYQLPALLLEGTCLVISPLLSLMKDQVSQLKNRGIEAEYISSELDDIEAEIIYNNCRDEVTKLLYVSPERLMDPIFLNHLNDIKLSFIAVDEAHCISEWGQDFRPSYQNISKFRSNFSQLSCIALTATATPKVLNEIEKKLELKKVQLFQKSFRRKNIKIFVDEISNKYERILNLLNFANSSGIIYARTRKETEDLCAFLKKQNKSVDFYHAGLSAQDKNRIQEFWLKSANHVIIATNAFGMGIDKDNVRFVIHLSPSASIENYYQEIGRAGRDGILSYAFLLWNKSEISSINDILYNAIPGKQEFLKINSFLYSTFQIAEHDLPEEIFELKIQNIQNFTKLSAAKIKNVLNFLHTQEIIFYQNKKSKSTLELKISSDEIDQLPSKDSYFIELLLRNISGFSSYKVSFNEDYLSEKLQINKNIIKERLKDLVRKNYLNYQDGDSASIKFLKHRNERLTENSYWQLFEQIQKNKLQKWEEMKFFMEDQTYCKMKLILSYFGEKNVQDCGICNICEHNKMFLNPKTLPDLIIELLAKNKFSLEQICVQLPEFNKEKILENVILLLDLDKIKMADFKTYTLN